jgi:lipopolysaccharide transport system permease protein
MRFLRIHKYVPPPALLAGWPQYAAAHRLHRSRGAVICAAAAGVSPLARFVHLARHPDGLPRKDDWIDPETMLKQADSQIAGGVDLAPPTVEARRQVIEPSHGWAAVDFRELWQYRGLLRLFIWRDLKVRYKQTTLGMLWVLLQPLAITVIYSIFFGYVAKIPSDGVPYPIFVLSGVVVWQFFSRAVTDGSTSLAAQQGLISKIYFPRLVAPSAAVFSALVDFLVMTAVLVALMLCFGKVPHWTTLFAPFFVLLATALALALSLILTAVDAVYRDVRYVLGFALQVWYFGTPVIYPVGLVPERWQTLLLLNPMAPVVQGFRWALLGNVPLPPAWSIASSLVVSAALLTGGALLFQRVERSIVDRI